MTIRQTRFRDVLNPIGGNPRIVIEYDPVRGLTTLKTEGQLSVLQVLDILTTQHASVWAQFIKASASSIVSPGGQPIVHGCTPQPPSPDPTESTTPNGKPNHEEKSS